MNLNERKLLAKKFIALAKKIAENDEKEEKQPKKEEPKKKQPEKKVVEEPTEEALVKEYTDNPSDVLDKLSKMKSLKAVHSALNIYKSLPDEAARSSFVRVVGRRIKKS